MFRKKTEECSIKPLTKEDIDDLKLAIDARYEARLIVDDCDKSITKIRDSIIASLKNSGKQVPKCAFKKIKYTNGYDRWVKILGADEDTLKRDNVYAFVLSRGDNYFFHIYCDVYSIYDLIDGGYEAITLEEFDEALRDAIKYIKTL